MKTWKEFFELKEAMGTTPPQNPRSARRSATLNPQDVQAYASGARPMTPATQQQPTYGAPVSDEEMGSQYAKSMQVQQAMTAAELARRKRLGQG